MRQSAYQEQRGWKRGTSRKYSDHRITERIVALKRNRIESGKYFVGSEHVRMDYDKTYGAPLPSTWYIDEVVRDAGLQTRQPSKGKVKGGSKYLLYPAASIRNLGTIHQSADFIGKKYITGSPNPVHIFSSAYYAPFKIFKIARVEAEKARYAIEELVGQWQRYPIPDVFRMDNGLQFRGTAYGKRAVGTFLKFLLNLNVIPLFGAPSKPWTNPYVEGHNRVFNEKVWRRHHFTDVTQIDRECGRFNEESDEYFRYRYAAQIFNHACRYVERAQTIVADRLVTTKNKKAYFIRFVESFDEDNNARIVILNEKIRIPEQYNHQFVFVEWNLEEERLNIFSEYEGQATQIVQTKFLANL